MHEPGIRKYPADGLPAADLDQTELGSVLAISDWLLGGARGLDAYPNAILAGLCERLNQVGVPVDRAASIVELRNAEAFAVSRVWEKGKDVQVHMFKGDGAPNEDYQASPFAMAHAERSWVLSTYSDLPENRFPTIEDQRAAGYSSHLVVPVILANGMNNAFVFASRAEGGFSEADLTMIRRIMPALGALQEILAIHRVLHEAMRMYVGDEPHRRILAGDARRGDVSEVRAAILFADMRDFTAITSNMNPAETTALLNSYYDCIVPPVEAAGGEVLKLIGDGVLAVFDAGDGSGSDQDICTRALEAAETALMAVARSGKAKDGVTAFTAGIGLHIGQVAYGNVGSGQRLDYTIIGRDVNIGARIAGLCAPLSRPLLMSEAFASHLSRHRGGLEKMGSHGLKGVPEPLEIMAGGSN